ncbi:MAG TPA: hypothetical protein PLO32_00760 [Chitinophagales bacterium]|nr:hypothetical protein [Chitinophagales bacterium]
MFYRVVQCGATEYEGTTLGTTKQTFGYIFMHQIKNDKMIKALFYKGLGVKERKRVRGCDNSTYPKGGVSCSKDSFVVNRTLVFQIKFCAKNPLLRQAVKPLFDIFRQPVPIKKFPKNGETKN